MRKRSPDVFSHVASLLFVGKIHDESSRGPWRNLLVFFTLTDFQYFLFVLRQSDCRLTANIRYCHESKQASSIGIVQQVVVVIESCSNVSKQITFDSSRLELCDISFC